MTDKLSTYRNFVKSMRSRVGYWKSYSLLQFTTSLTRIMRLDKVSGKTLASRLGLSAQQVSKVLRGNENITIETMAKFAGALDAVVHIHVAKRGVPVQWVELPAAHTTPPHHPSEQVEPVPTRTSAQSAKPRVDSRGIR